MEGLLYIRQKTKMFFADYDMYIIPMVKFVLMMAIFLLMNWHLGYRYVQMKWILVILVSLVGCLLPWSGLTALSGLYLMGHVSALSWEGAVVLAAVMLAAVIIHYLFLPGSSFVIVLVPLAFYLKVPYLIPLLVGVFGSALSFLPVGIGVMVYYLMLSLERGAAFLSDPGSSIAQCFLQILNGLAGDSMLIVTLASFCLVTLLVYTLNRLSFDYSKYISIAAGGVLNILIFLFGGILLETTFSYAGLLIGTLVCTFAAVLISFWVGAVDYSRAERLQFEDDEYVYYVKAVPKISIAVPDRKVQEITSPKESQKEEL
ncbi:MAG: hypothetical protein PUB22_09585 [Clostridiales bacterium]|nr:hypothetical protein [Clostridiales bacterium]